MIEVWREAWPKALALWSDFVMLREPRLCKSSIEAAKENLTSSFAMIRFSDQQVVINLEEVAKYKLENFALEILAHEIGHHVYCPANLTDHALMLAKMRKALPMRETFAPFIANLYADLMLNDRLQRSCGLRMDAIYLAIKTKNQPPLWQFYLRIYEILWSLERKTLTADVVASEIEGDALLGARLIRAYSHDPNRGASGFATLVFPYLAKENDPSANKFKPLFDMENSSSGSDLPSGLAEDDDAEDIDSEFDEESLGSNGSDGSSSKKQDRVPRDIVEYGEILKMLGTKLTDKQIVSYYYRELSNKYLIPFPEIRNASSKELQAEGLDTWELGDSLENIDWFQSVALSRTLIPGVTIVERHYSEIAGQEPEKLPIDLYIGIDCSGSMSNPAFSLSYPVLAGVILARSALRAKARVMACLSGESQGKTIATEGFIRNENQILELITDYLGTGYAFGIHHLAQHIIKRKKLGPAHVLIVSDQDIFAILNESKAPLIISSQIQSESGWAIAEDAVKSAGGGGTMVLNIDANYYKEDIKRLEDIGWNVFTINSFSEIVHFAKQFSRKVYLNIGNDK